MAARTYLWGVLVVLFGTVVASGSCVLPGYEFAGAGGAGASAPGGAGGGAGADSGGGAGGAFACVDRPPECTLNSDGNCGECGRSCDEDAPCVDNLCPVRELEDGDAWFMAYRDGLLFWTYGEPHSGDSGGLARIDLSVEGSKISASGPGAPTGLWVDASYAFFTVPSYSGIVSALAHGQSVEASLFDEFLESNDDTSGVAVSDEDIFFAIADDSGSIQRGPYEGNSASGGASEGLFANVAHAVALAVHGDHLYWTTRGDSDVEKPAGVWRRGVNGGDVEALHRMDGNQRYSELAINSTHLYWASATGVQRIPLAGPFPVDTPESVSSDTATGVVVDDNTVYWAEYEEGRVMKRVEYCDGWAEPVLLYQGNSISHGLTIGEGRVFFSDDDYILSLPR